MRKMRLRKIFALVGAVTVLGGCVLLYLVLDLTLIPSANHAPLTRESHSSNTKWGKQFESSLEKLEGDIKRNQNKVQEIKEAIDTISELVHINTDLKDAENEVQAADDRTCPAPTVADVLMLDLYNSIPFDNPDGGVWKQGWNIEYNKQQWGPKRKLKVFLIPHSHNDPGWLKTFEDYYHSQTKAILTNLIAKLSEDSRRKFIWAEVSYLMLWWSEQNDQNKEKLRQLVQSGQLEIVTGGWVMNDEANAHFWAVVQQLTEGHEWLMQHLGVRPKHAWAIDPFGHSATEAYILKKSRMEFSLIQRVHYSVKKRLAQDKGLEFRWRQGWSGPSTDMLTHMMPFYSYDVPHTCGPDPKVCCQFDFKRLPGYGVTCPWRISPQQITDDNVRQRAELLLDQYRKKAQLYRTNALLVPLGDDFRYDHSAEWDAQFNNYQALFDHMNSRHDLYVEAKFATLADYFNALKAETGGEKNLPSLTGDFFTYADRDDHYWSGYFTSRPYYKRLDRVLIGYLRAAEVLFSLAWGHGKSEDNKGVTQWLTSPHAGLRTKLDMARQANALFQHHDGVTGTAKDHVMRDYGNKMIKAIDAAQHVIQMSTQYLLYHQLNPQLDPNDIYFHLDDTRPRTGALSKRNKITFGEGLATRKIVLFNSLNRARTEFVKLRVAQYNVKVSDYDGQSVPSQVQPLFDEMASMVDGEYELIFIVTVPPFSLSTYLISWTSSVEEQVPLASVSLANHQGQHRLHSAEGFEQIGSLPEGQDIKVTSQQLSAVFSNHGLLRSVTVQGLTIPVKLEFVQYGARKGGERSGAYLFLPDGPAKIVTTRQAPLVRVISGPVATQIEVQLPFVLHTATIYNCSGEVGGSIEIVNLVELVDGNNIEIAMRFSSDIESGDTYFTDLNAFQMIERRRQLSKLPLQAHYFPMSSMGFIEDSGVRLSLVSGQPLGAASLQTGQFEVMQDRRLGQDDNRGLNQGVQDNHPTPNVFRLLLERKSCQSDHWPRASLAAHLSHQSLLMPLVHLIAAGDPLVPLKPSFTPNSKSECGLHVLNLRTSWLKVRPRAGLVVHQLSWDECLPPPPGLQCAPEMSSLVNVSSVLPGFFGAKMKKASLTFLHEAEEVSTLHAQPVCPNELAAFLLG
ncbi:alpha-mannosidase 2 [Neocloeon triangulifer]|uniref:alpha-mannosidase 2 n=1 Tax=Neocloeon triangulifer TaxID=2078957 RepID=UPI00286ED727|nr:alpha-mannosidase 2 [Neocloeon triangulifer]